MWRKGDLPLNCRMKEEEVDEFRKLNDKLSNSALYRFRFPRKERKRWKILRRKLEKSLEEG